MFGLFYEKGLGRKEYLLRIGNITAIRTQLAYVNEWMDLVNMGNSIGTKSDQPKLKKLDNFLSTCEDRKTLENFKIKISTGEMGCVMCAETKDELEKMRKIILSASEIDIKHHEKINGLFDRLIAYLSSDESDHALYDKLSNRQYIDTGIARDDYLD